MADYIKNFDNDDEKYITGLAVQPQKFNILLTRDGDEIDFDFSPATAELITRYGYLMPVDKRCANAVIFEEDDIYDRLSPVLGNTFTGQLSYHTRKQVIISLHDTAILGYQRQTIVDPRIGNEIAVFWEIYLDQRIFTQCDDDEWQLLMAEVIASESVDKDADRKLAEDIKNRLLEQAEI
ncbi:MAG: hypothetical protein OSB62_07775 [Alphaproteobacteria bacterium]|nr:hypothetical protein [Alphaproteobacteria bacterium]